jgi:hypothetical protein
VRGQLRLLQRIHAGGAHPVESDEQSPQREEVIVLALEPHSVASEALQ